jgi:hypothetical protein
MSVYATNFSEYTVDQFPTGWTERYADTDYDAEVIADAGALGAMNDFFNQ